MDAIAGELPPELEAVAEVEGKRAWLPLTREVAEVLHELRGGKMDDRALRCAQELLVGREPAPASLALIDGVADRRFTLHVNWDPTRSPRSSSCRRSRRTGRPCRSTRRCSSRSSTSCGPSAWTSLPRRAARSPSCARSTTRRSRTSAARARRPGRCSTSSASSAGSCGPSSARASRTA
jgi:hypothetical protein